jgi:hypothetical protein
MAFEANTRIRAEDKPRRIAASEEVMKVDEHVCVLMRVSHFDGASLDALREQGLASMKLKGVRQVEGHALVGGPPRVATLASGSAPPVRLQTRDFDLDREEEAWRWMSVEPQPGTAQGDFPLLEVDAQS